MRKKNIVYALYLFSITIISLEIILRIYNPFHFRIKGEKIILNTNKQYIFYNKSIPVIEDTIVHSVNSLGFRGPERPEKGFHTLSVISIGGSTTACTYLSDSLTWSHKLSTSLNDSFNIWFNNAGLGGHSTFGHLVLLKDYVIRLKPKVILFLVGCNDIERDDLTSSDNANMANKYKNVFTFLSKKSELCNTVINLLRSRRAAVNRLADTYIDLKVGTNDSLIIPDQEISGQLMKQKGYLTEYKKRVEEMIEVCRSNRIQPVLITQPSLFGPAVDSLTGVNLERYKLWKGMNGLLWWKRMELYNDITREVAREQEILLIDLAKVMPKSSAYFYDIVHFTNAGTSKVSDIIYRQLYPWLHKEYGTYLKGQKKDTIGK
ncbi:SGNH/GDSL hydrolase family protein [Paraflavitalea soli]|uniref:SGNH/GDSL hydrolase family protein n=1 Tax=Paraflavitalea soli TaxID=2315862 RepID=A0A3B7MR39_9BACT|nr:GDSL-type esterase/lipase family protein [Paraflavitalea soli]AXY75436.1 SGNH/GDSL hydrolase family protein [Paraflavitalea soli]